MPTRDTYCPAHQRAAWTGSQRFSELPKDWNRRRRIVLARDIHCTTEGCTNRATEVHHIKDKHDHAIGSLAGICHDCHVTETARQSAAAKGRGATPKR